MKKGIILYLLYLFTEIPTYIIAHFFPWGYWTLGKGLSAWTGVYSDRIVVHVRYLPRELFAACVLIWLLWPLRCRLACWLKPTTYKRLNLFG
jgi:hypothetical protein